MCVIKVGQECAVISEILTSGGKKAAMSVLCLNLNKINLQPPECIGAVAPLRYTYWLAAQQGHDL